MASAIVDAVNNYDDPKRLAAISKGLGSPMKGIEVSTLAEEELLQVRGW
jgi:pyridoxal 5'-phosphate synthase pdxS subunit